MQFGMQIEAFLDEAWACATRWKRLAFDIQKGHGRRKRCILRLLSISQKGTPYRSCDTFEATSISTRGRKYVDLKCNPSRSSASKRFFTLVGTK